MNFTCREEIINGFIDAGCSKEQIKIVQENIDDYHKLIDILVNQRKIMLDKIHEDENKMRCIDYLLYNLKHKN